MGTLAVAIGPLLVLVGRRRTGRGAGTLAVALVLLLVVPVLNLVVSIHCQIAYSRPYELRDNDGFSNKKAPDELC